MLVKEKESQLGQAYEELGLLAGARRARLEESRRLWQFLWELGEEAAWIREQEQILAAGDCGRDLSSALHLLSKHEAFRDEMAARYGPLGHSIAAGEQLVSEGHFGAPEVTERIADVREQWAHLEEVRTWGKGCRLIEREEIESKECKEQIQKESRKSEVMKEKCGRVGTGSGEERRENKPYYLLCGLLFCS